MLDGQGRNIDYLRISVTDRCSLRCIYCMPEEGVECLRHEDILTYDEILRIVSLMASSCGIKKIKLTGGEPLVRKGLPGLLKAIKEIPGIEKVTLTTNGVALAEQMDALAEAGVDGINISLDTLDRERFQRLTRVDALDLVIGGLSAARTFSEIPLKINCVPITGEDEDLIFVASIAKHNPIHVRFIEIMPIGCGRTFQLKSEQEIRNVLEKRYGSFTPDDGVYGNGPARYYSVPDFIGRIGFISAVTHQFCSSCNRLRLTSEGFLKTCLQYETGVDLRAILRGGGTDEELLAAIRQAVREKPMCHSFADPSALRADTRSMNRIGG